jgi:erythromycin esterase
MIRLSSCWIICQLIVLHSLTAQNFYNVDFEYGVYKDQPRKWSIESEGEGHTASLDSIESESGKKSLKAKLKNAEMFLFLSLPKNLIAGKKIRFSGFVKSSSGDSLKLMLAFKDPKGRPLITPIENTNPENWNLVSTETFFPDNYSSDRLLVALVAAGSGEFRFDNASIQVDGMEAGKGEIDFREPTPLEIQMLNQKIIPIRSVDDHPDVSDLYALDRVIGNSRLVALGENSHGSSSIYKMKFRMVRYLVIKKGFTVFALESPVAEADKINAYVTRGAGNREDVLKNLVYKSWQTQEMLDIIEWIKVYNQRAKHKVEFRGFDCQNSALAFHEVEVFIKNNSKSLASSFEKLKNDYTEALKTDSGWPNVYQQAEQIKNGLLSASIYPAVKSEALERVNHYMNIFLQNMSSHFQSPGSKSRDEYMADNIHWLVKNSSRDSRFIISADNSHVTKQSGKMGSMLQEKHGKDYFAMAFTFQKGTYFAYGPQKFYDVHPPHSGTYEYFFSGSMHKNFILELEHAKTIPILMGTLGFRSIGSRPQEITQFSDLRLTDHFDAVINLEESTHTIPIEQK